MKGITFSVLGLVLSLFALVFLDISNEKQKEKLKSLQVKTVKQLTEVVENAYLEGQRDALEGDIRIRKTDTGYEWIKSPWNEGEK